MSSHHALSPSRKTQQCFNTKSHLLWIGFCVCFFKWFETVLFQIIWVISKLRSQLLILIACSESYTMSSSFHVGIIARNLFTWCLAIPERWDETTFSTRWGNWGSVCMQQNHEWFSQSCAKVKSAPKAHGTVALNMEGVTDWMSVSLSECVCWSPWPLMCQY